MSGRNIPGVIYPREVHLPVGVPAGLGDDWTAIESAYAQTSIHFGSTYVRYHSKDGKHKHVGSAKKVMTVHCEQHGLDLESMLAEFESKRIVGGATIPITDPLPSPGGDHTNKAEKSSTDRSAPASKSDEPSGKKAHTTAPASKSDEPSGKKAHKTAPASKSDEPSSKKARTRDSPGSMNEAVPKADVPKSDEPSRKKARPEDPPAPKTFHDSIDEIQHMDPFGAEQKDWASLETSENVQNSFVEFRSLMKACMFSVNTVLIALCGLSKDRHFAARVHGVYYQLPELLEGRPCYQKLLRLPKCTSGLGCDAMYIVWNEASSEWCIGPRPIPGSTNIARCKGSQDDLSKVTSTWEIAGKDGQFQEDTDLNVQVPIAAETPAE